MLTDIRALAYHFLIALPNINRDQDLTKTDMMLKDFEGNVSPVKGVTCVELTIGSKTLPTTFFVISEKGAL